MASCAPNSNEGDPYSEAAPSKGHRLNLAVAIRLLAPLGVLIALLAGLGLFQPSFLSLYSLSVLAGESSVILVLAAGQTLVILFGGIDLSMAAVASLASVLIALSLPWAGVVGLLGVLALTALIGAAQGFVYTRAQLPSFVVTLAGLGLWSGLALVIGHTTIPVTAGYEAVGWLKGRDFGVPHAFAFAVFATGALVVMLRWSPIGRYIYAIGMGEVAALLSGVPVGRVKIFVLALSGLFAGLAGMMMVARTYGGNPTIADSLLLPSIAAVVIGGTAITGGSGGLGRTIIGALTIGVLRVGIAVVGLDPAYEPIAYGLFIIVAVALSIDRSANAIVK
jgi:ribose transport system permease protein